jgi:hypothetical protein
MRSRAQVWHAFDAQLQAILPGVNRARLHVFALLTLGLLWAETATLPRVARTLPLTVKRVSTQRRLARFLANPEVDPDALWGGLLPHLLADRAGAALTLVFDPTPHTDRFTVLVLGLLDHSRVLPLAWRIVPQQTAWDAEQIVYLRALCEAVVAALPPRATVTLLADRGITGPAVIALCRRLGWSFVLRVSVSAAQTNRVRVGGLAEQPLWDLVTAPGQRFARPALLYKDAGWIALELTIRWDRGYAEPWVLVSDRPAGPAIAAAYRRRVKVEATYQDGKSRGFRIEATTLTQPDRLHRLLLALHLALWWALQLGHRLIRAGLRPRYDRADRRDLGVIRLGREHLEFELLHDRIPPLPFRFHHDHWAYTWCR